MAAYSGLMPQFNINIATSRGLFPVTVGFEGERIDSITYTDGAHASPTRLIIPSPVDLHVHLRDFEQRQKETVSSGTRAALAGGICAVADMPNTVPPVADRETYERRLELMSHDAACDFVLNFFVDDKYSLSQAASVDPFFIKVFLGETTGSYVLEKGLLENVFMLRKPVAIHADLGGMRKAIKYSKRYETPLHICHVSRREEVELIARHKDERITCEATPHHLFLSGDHAVKPPLGNANDRDALWAALGTTIDIVASDHAPHTLEEKEHGAFGISGVETLLPLMVTALVRGEISFKHFYAVMHENPKRILRSHGIEYGFGVGGRADFSIVDTSKSYAIDPALFHSKAKHSPFSGMEVEARVVETWVRGKRFFSNGVCTNEARGASLSAFSKEP